MRDKSETTVKQSDFQNIVDNYIPGQLGPSEGPPVESFNDKKILPVELQKVLEGLIKELAIPELYPRRWEAMESRLQRFYYRDQQYLILDAAESILKVAVNGKFGKDESDQEYRHIINIYKQCAQSFVAALSKDIPGLKFQPSNPKNPEDISTSNIAEKLKLLIERNNNMGNIFTDAALKFWTDGRIGFYTRYVVDGSRYGWEDDNKTKPKGQEQIDTYGVLELKVPFKAKNQNEFTFLQCSTEISKADARARYPQFASKINTGAAPGEEEYIRIARMGVNQGTALLTQTGGAFVDVITEQKTWLRPSAFLLLADIEKREQLLKLFKNGCYVCFCGTQYVESRNESMDDHWVVTHPDPGDGQNRPSRGLSVVEIQDMVNDIINIKMQTYCYQIPAVFYNPTVIDGDALSSQVSSAKGNRYPIIEGSLQPGEPISNAFYSEPLPTVSADMDTWLTQLMGQILQNLTGLQPSIFGGADESNETASGIAQLKESSEGQLISCWNALKNAYAKIMTQAIRCSSYRSEDISTILSIGNKDEAVEIKSQDLQGNVVCFPAEAQGLPQTLDEQSSAIEMLLTQSVNLPALQLLLQDPNNLQLLKQYSGLDDLCVPGADERNKQLMEISDLISEPPIPTEQYKTWEKLSKIAQKAGHPPIPRPADNILYEPSVKIDIEYDNHPVEWNTVKEWINSEEGQRVKADDPDGFLNVRLHGLMHKQQVDLDAQKNAPQPPAPRPPTPKIPTKSVKTNSLTQAQEITLNDLPIDSNAENQKI